MLYLVGRSNFKLAPAPLGWVWEVLVPSWCTQYEQDQSQGVAALCHELLTPHGTDFFSSKHFHILASFRICLKKGRDGHILILQREVEAEMEPASPRSQG